jgi:hypothetical protein
MKKVGMDIQLPGNLAHWHTLLGDQLYCISLELPAEVTVFVPHAHLLSHSTNS